jgi:hypothetical protein
MRRDKFSDPRTYVIGRSKDPTNPNIPANLADFGNTLWFRRYFDDPGAAMNTETTIDGYVFDRYNTRHDRSFSRLDTLQAHFVGEYFSDQLTLIGGVRRDENTQRNRVGVFTAGVRTRDNTTLAATKATSKNVGLSYFPRWFAHAGLYANMTDGFRPQGTTNPWLRGVGPTVSPSLTYGYGVRLRLLEGKVVGSLGGYQSREKDALTQVSGVRDEFNTLWTAVNRPDRIIQAPFNVIDDSIDRTGRGWEADFTVNLGQRLRVKMNAAFPQAKQTNALPDIRAYVA